MASKPLIIASLIGASVGVPYFASQAKHGNQPTPTPLPLPATMTAASPVASPVAPVVAAPASAPVAPPLAAAGGPVASLTGVTPAPTPTALPPTRAPSAEQALRFDVTRDWVYRSWDRKTTAPTDVGLLAVRVPMVSGTQSASLAGALTYYFNAQHQVEHISFRGRTGDPSRLVRFVMQTYQLQPAAAATGEQLYQVADRSGVQSELIIRPESTTTTSRGNYSVELELARPGSQRYLPSRGPFLNVPQTPDSIAPTPDASASSSAADKAGTTGSGYLDKVRYATPQEESQKYWKRWPN